LFEILTPNFLFEILTPNFLFEFFCFQLISFAIDKPPTIPPQIQNNPTQIPPQIQNNPAPILAPQIQNNPTPIVGQHFPCLNIPPPPPPTPMSDFSDFIFTDQDIREIREEIQRTKLPSQITDSVEFSNSTDEAVRMKAMEPCMYL
jgi:type IV secretory pathway VirB10-like protein